MANRTYTLEQQVQVVKEYLENGKSFTEIAQAYDLSSQLIRSWVRKYQEMGLLGLEDRRGQRMAEQTPRTPEEELRIRNAVERYYDTPINDKRALCICRSLSVKSTIKYASHGCTKRASAPQHIVENLLGRRFHADKPNDKRLTDVSVFRYYVGPAVHKIYLSDRGIQYTTQYFMTSWWQRVCPRACHVLASVLTTVPWKVFGDSQT